MRSTPSEKAPKTFFFPFDTGFQVPDTTGTTKGLSLVVLLESEGQWHKSLDNRAELCPPFHRSTPSSVR